jgi:hypothetical protein
MLSIVRHRVLVCGGRNYSDMDRLFSVLGAEHAVNPIDDLIHGAAKGADMLAHEWAYRNNVRMHPFLADWETYGRRAGVLRNQRMLDEGRPDLVIAFPGGRGTADMVRRAERAGIHVTQIAP